MSFSHTKKLSAYAIQLPKGEDFVFNSTLTPDVEIAVACRASSAIPGVIEPIVIQHQGLSITLVDGGYRHIIPTEFFDQNGLGNSHPEETLVVCFADNPNLKQSAPYRAINEPKGDNDLFKPPFFEKQFRNYGCRFFADMDTPYTNIESSNEDMLRMRDQYKDNTIVLGIGEIRHHDYQKATLLGRAISAVCYMDTMWYVNTKKQPHAWDDFFGEFNKIFEIIYHSLVYGSGKLINSDPFTIELIKIKRKFTKIPLSSPQISEPTYQCIREQVRNNLDSLEAFAFTRTMEYMEGLILPNDLLMEIHDRCMYPSPYAVSSHDASLFIGAYQSKPKINISIFNENLKAVEREQSYQNPINRILCYLNKIENFKERMDYSAHSNEIKVRSHFV